MPGAGAHRPGARHQQSQGRAARELRARLRRDFRLLRRAVDGARRRYQRTASGRPGRRGSRMRSSAWPAWRCCSGGPVRPTSRSASAFPPSGAAAPGSDAVPASSRAADGDAPASKKVVLVIRVPHLNLPRPALLDLYVSRPVPAGLRPRPLRRCSASSTSRRSWIWPTSCFAGRRRARMMLRYFFFQTPQYVYYIIPMAALVATLVTVGLMTKNSELVVMRACGISLYRTAAPLLLFAVAASAVLFGLQEQVMAHSNREADRLNRVIRGLSAGKLRGAGPALDGRAERRHLSLRFLRRPQERVPPVRRLSPGPGALGSALGHSREPGRADSRDRRWRADDRAWNGWPRPAGRASFPRRPSGTSRRPRSTTSRIARRTLPLEAPGLLQERRARRRR